MKKESSIKNGTRFQEELIPPNKSGFPSYVVLGGKIKYEEFYIYKIKINEGNFGLLYM